ERTTSPGCNPVCAIAGDCARFPNRCPCAAPPATGDTPRLLSVPAGSCCNCCLYAFRVSAAELACGGGSSGGCSTGGSSIGAGSSLYSAGGRSGVCGGV